MSGGRYRCGDCIHNGCCDGLPYCGGSSWSPAYGECENCGGRVPLDDVEWETEDGEHVFCSENCLNEWLEENEQEESDDEQETEQAAH